MALEGQDVVSKVYDLLAADTGAGGVSTLLGGRIYRDRVPAAASLPAATVTLVSHTDLNTMGGTRVVANTLVDVRVVGSGSSYATLNPVARRADVVLQEAGGTSFGSVVVKLRRTAVTQFIEDDSGVMYAHVVQTYRSEAYAT
jgi:hypothetical protein